MQMDLTEVKSIKLIQESCFDIIIHCASVLATSENSRDMALFHENIRITESLLLLIRKWKPKVVVNLSTMGVYPNLNGNYDENSLIKPSLNFEGLYGLAKFCSEELLSFSLAKNEIRVVNLRLGQTIGPGMRPDRIYSKMKEELLNKNEILVHGEGERVSSFLSIQYLVEVVNQIISNHDVKDTYNVAEYNLTYRELAEKIISEYGNANSKIIFTKEGSRAKVRIDTRKLNSELK